MTVISTYFSENTQGARAEVIRENEYYKIRYYDMNGNVITTEHHEGKSLDWVESAAENWALGVKHLNG